MTHPEANFMICYLICHAVPSIRSITMMIYINLTFYLSLMLNACRIKLNSIHKIVLDISMEFGGQQAFHAGARETSYGDKSAL